MPSLRAIADPVLAAGFRLAGLEVDEVATSSEAAAVLGRLSGTPGVGVVLIRQDWFDALPEALRRAIERQPVPIVVPVPRADWTGSRAGAEAYILDLLQRAIGYRVRLQ